MQSENRTCQNCKQDFTIEPDDFGFYEKIKVPPPTFCPDCRMARRLMWRNERSLSKRECGLCRKPIISMYSDTEAPVYCSDCWNGDGWDQYANQREYDFSRPFFIQLKELFAINPRLYAYKFGNFINSEFINYAKDDKNCYLSYSVIDCEDILYSALIDVSKNTTDCFNVMKLEGCYENINCEGNYNTHFALNSQNCLDSMFLYDCNNCTNCFMSSNLRNQQYYFYNKKLSKEAYLEEIKKLNISSYYNLQKLKSEFKNLVEKHSIHKYAFIYSAENSTGDYIHNVKNLKKSFDVYNAENMSYAFRVLYAKDGMDLAGCGYGEMCYESVAATMNTFGDSFCYITIQGCRECEYSLVLKNCTNCFGCVGLINAKYCIMNKQYEKDEYFEMVEKIKRHMVEMPYKDEKSRVFTYGEFFPYDMCPFGYNETNAHDYMPIPKQKAEEMGYKWKEREKRDYKITKNSEDLPDNINDVDDTILNEVIACPNNGEAMTQCTSAYRIVPEELSFYRLKNLPLPRHCPNCRHYERLKYRNPFHLWHRSCMKEGCQNEFETSYAPERPEIIYCEKCYQQEVY